MLAILVVLTGYFGYLVYTQHTPCVTPITYSLAAYDERFGLPKEEVERNLLKAAAVWNKALGMDALVQSSEPVLPVSFVYDETQRTVDSISSIENKIDAQKEELKVIANKYANLKEQYDALNNQGKATKEMYDELTRLHAQYEDLRLKINSDVKRGQRLPAGEIEEGKYVSDSEGTRIYIYAFQDKTELMRTLIHEFGHSLGLKHVENEDSIMYPKSNESQSIALSPEDVAELTKACAESRSSVLGRLYLLSEPILKQIEPLIQSLSGLAK